jgi:hypothetical protein
VVLRTIFLVFNELELELELELDMSVSPLHDGRVPAAITKLKPRYQQDVDNFLNMSSSNLFPSI